MLIDSEQINNGALIEVDLCIIGAGAAGITIARSMQNQDISICLLESGGFFGDGPEQKLYHGQATGTVLKPKSTYLSHSRMRAFGGSTNHWSGWCRPIDSWVFEKREWIANSGWPISRSELDPYYSRATKVVEIKEFNYKLSDRLDANRPQLLEPPLLEKDDAVRTVIFHQSKPTRFGATYRGQLERAKRIKVILHSNVVDIETNPAGTAIEQVQVATLGEKKFLVKAKEFILATGGIENPRILLASNRVQKAGLGNENDLVGRFFMDHPEIPEVGEIVVTAENNLMKLYRPHKDPILEHLIYGVFSLSEKKQKENKLRNAGFFFSRELSGKHVPPLMENIAEISSATDFHHQDLPENELPLGHVYHGTVKSRLEPSPNRDSRVTLDEKRDALGMPRAKLDWRLNPEDSISVRKSLDILAREFGRLGDGRVKVKINDENLWPQCIGGAHHMGTTRMDENPKNGVVDKNCKVHGLANLYIAGSSVFPSPGFSNPTLTIVALAIRLADHMTEKLAQKEVNAL